MAGTMGGRARRVTIAALAAALLLPEGAGARPLDEVAESGTMVVAVYRDFPPFSYGEEGQMVGIDVDIAHAIAAALGVQARIMPLTADETVDDDLRNAVWKGHYLSRQVADLMLHVPVDRQFALRNDQAVIFGPYFRKRIALAYDSERLGGFSDLLELDGETIGVELDSLSDFFLTGAYGGRLRANVVHFRSSAEIADALRSGRVGVVMAPQSDVEGTLGPGETRIRFRPVTMGGFASPSWLIGAAVKEDSRDLGYAVGDIIDAMVTGGRMQAIFAKRRVTWRPPTAD